MEVVNESFLDTRPGKFVDRLAYIHMYIFI